MISAYFGLAVYLGPAVMLNATIAVLIPLGLLLYAYLGYPGIMWLISRRHAWRPPKDDPEEWPEITIILPVYNEERVVAATLDSLLALDYPADKRHILVVSDASTDRTDEIVRSYEGRGIELIRLSQRSGKTTAENTAAARVHGSIIVNTDATIRILPASLKALLRVFQDPDIGLASGRDVSVGDVHHEANRGESGYVGYEMWLRSLESRVGSIVGASGCFFAIRRELFDVLFPSALSRDFASALMAVDRGFRAVSVDDAICLVPRAASLRTEYRRKVRTMTRGLETLWYKRGVATRSGFLFGFQLVSHKFLRWLFFLFTPLIPVGLGILATRHAWALVAFALLVLTSLLGGLAFLWPEDRRPPRILAFPGFLVGSVVAGFLAWIKAFRGELNPIWEPTRRPNLAS